MLTLSLKKIISFTFKSTHCILLHESVSKEALTSQSKSGNFAKYQNVSNPPTQKLLWGVFTGKNLARTLAKNQNNQKATQKKKNEVKF